MTDDGPEPVRLRAGWYDKDAADARPTQPAPMVPPRNHGTRTRRAFHWGEHPLAEVGLGVTGSLAVAGWLTVALLIFMLVDDRDGPEGMAGFAVVVLMPQVLLVTFSFSAVAAFVWYRYWGGRVSRAVGAAAAIAAVIALVGWLAVFVIFF